MINTFNLLFRNSPLLLAEIDDTLVCRNISLKWREHLGLAATTTIAISVEQLFDLENEISLAGQIEQVIHQGSIIKGRAVSLLKQKSSIKPAHKGLLSAWRIQQTQDEQVSALLLFTETTEFSQTISTLNRLQNTHELI